MTEPASYNFIPEVYIIESATMNDYLKGRQEGRALQESLKIMGIPNYYFPVFTRDGLRYVLDQVKSPHCLSENAEENSVTFSIPVIHISAHGADDRFGLTDNTDISWKDLRNILAPINTKCNGCLFLCMSVCHGFMAYKAAETLKATEIPFYQLIGPKTSILWQDSLLAFLVFYRRFDLMCQDQSKTLKDIMNYTISNNIFEIVDSNEVQANYHDKLTCITNRFLQAMRDKKR